MGLAIRVLVLSTILAWLAHAQVESEEELQSIEKAHAAIAEVRANFRKALNEAVKKGDLNKALPGCRIKNLPPDGMKVGRTSHRLRNQENAPPEWTKPYLEKFSQATKRTDIPAHVLTKLGPQRYGYLEPIYIEPICLNCHGRSVKAEVKAAIRERYPQDQALNFEVGDFRGLLWLEAEERAAPVKK